MRGCDQTAVAGTTIGTVLFTGGVFADGRIGTDDLRLLGATIIVACICWYLSNRMRVGEEAAYEAGRQVGWEQGFQDARARTGRPTVVPLRVLTNRTDFAGDCAEPPQPAARISPH